MMLNVVIIATTILFSCSQSYAQGNRTTIEKVYYNTTLTISCEHCDLDIMNLARKCEEARIRFVVINHGKFTNNITGKVVVVNCGADKRIKCTHQEPPSIKVYYSNKSVHTYSIMECASVLNDISKNDKVRGPIDTTSQIWTNDEIIAISPNIVISNCKDSSVLIYDPTERKIIRLNISSGKVSTLIYLDRLKFDIQYIPHGYKLVDSNYEYSAPMYEVGAIKLNDNNYSIIVKMMIYSIDSTRSDTTTITESAAAFVLRIDLITGRITRTSSILYHGNSNVDIRHSNIFEDYIYIGSPQDALVEKGYDSLYCLFRYELKSGEMRPLLVADSIYRNYNLGINSLNAISSSYNNMTFVTQTLSDHIYKLDERKGATAEICNCTLLYGHNKKNRNTDGIISIDKSIQAYFDNMCKYQANTIAKDIYAYGDNDAFALYSVNIPNRSVSKLMRIGSDRNLCKVVDSFTPGCAEKIIDVVREKNHIIARTLIIREKNIEIRRTIVLANGQN